MRKEKYNKEKKILIKLEKLKNKKYKRNIKGNIYIINEIKKEKS